MTSSSAPVVHDARRWSREDEGEDGATAPARQTGDHARRAVPDGGPLPLIRIGTMVRTVLEELRRAPLDEAGRERAAEVHRRARAELLEHLDPDLRTELQALDVPLPDDATPGDAELRVAQAQLVGWLDGLFQGAQIAVMSHQMATRAQLEQLRGDRPDAGSRGHGQYL